MNDLIKNFITLCKETIPPVHKEGQIFVALAICAAIFLMALGKTFGAFSGFVVIGLIIIFYVAFFFRDPKRVTPQGSDLIISPADGIVHKIEMAPLPEELGVDSEDENESPAEPDQVCRVSIFLNIFNVHVNRIPMGGKVTALNYRPGLFLSANLDKASEENERQCVVIENNDGKRLVCIQIAGQIARRIVCNLRDDDDVVAGERYGIIRFGSRVDIYLPKGVEPLVTNGQTMIGGETILAKIDGKQTAMNGVAT